MNRWGKPAGKRDAFDSYSRGSLAVRTVFALANGRSGTHYLYEIIRRNAVQCVVRHEPYVFNPSMFGRPIYDRWKGNLEPVRRLVEKKRRAIDHFSPATYVETSHAFLKSYFEIAPEYFPQMKVVHLVRHPMQTAKSLANREQLIRWLRLPFCNYRGDDGCEYFRWSLTGREPIYQHFSPSQLTRFQWYVLEWIEIENRAARFIKCFGQQIHCVTLRVPDDINDGARLRQMFDALALPTRNTQIVLAGRKNRTPGTRTLVTSDEERQFAQIVRQLPAEYLAIFRAAPYATCNWVSLLAS